MATNGNGRIQWIIGIAVTAAIQIAMIAAAWGSLNAQVTDLSRQTERLDTQMREMERIITDIRIQVGRQSQRVAGDP